MAEQFIFHMQDLNKSYGSTHVLKDFHLSFYPGAKIGIVGENGSGKATILRIMAGEVTDFEGEAWLSKGYTCGYVPQEPKLDPDRTVREIIEGAFAATVAKIQEFEDISASMAEPMEDDAMQRALERMSATRDDLDADDDRHAVPQRTPASGAR